MQVTVSSYSVFYDLGNCRMEMTHCWHFGSVFLLFVGFSDSAPTFHASTVLRT